MSKKKFKTMNIFIGIALAILLFGLFNLGISTLLPSPQYDNYCNASIYPKVSPDGTYRPQTQEEIDNQDKCNTDFNNALKEYEQKVFYYFIIGGLLFALAGLLYIQDLTFQIVSVGAGLGLVGEAIYRNFDNKSSVFVAGLIVFLIIAYVVYRRKK